MYLAAMAGPVGFRKLVVIKRIREDVPDRAAYTTMLLEEAQLAARLQHPNVVQTFEVGVHEGQHYIAMEYLEGQPIAKVLQVGGRPAIAFTVQVMADALAGLEYAHTLADYDGRPLRIVHRDVSPQNLFVTYAGEVKVVDFGVAKTSIQAGHTDVGVIKGKVGYMSPEQLNQGAVDRRTDVFAAGVVFWEMLTGRRLFKGNSEVEAIAKVLYEPVTPPSALFPDIPSPLEAICLRALDRDPSARWQSAREMREALYRYMAMPGAGTFRRDDVGRYLNARFEQERQEVRARVTEFMAEADAAAAPGHDAPTAIENLRSLVVSRPSGPPASIDVVSLPTGPTVPTAPSAPSHKASHRPAPRVSAPPPPPTVKIHREPASPKLKALTAAALVGAGTAFGVAIWKHFAHPTVVAHTADAAAPASTLPPPVLTLDGSGTLAVKAIPLLVEEFFKKRGATSVRRERGAQSEDTFVVATTSDGEEVIYVRSEATARGFVCLGERSCDVAMAARAIRPAEAADLIAKGVGDVRSAASEHVVALDGVAVVVNPASTVKSLELGQIEGIFTGSLKNWAAVGAAGGPIAVKSHDEGSGTLDVFIAIALGGRPLSPDAKKLPSNEVIADSVASEPNAIGYVGLSFVRGARALAVGDRNVAPMFPSAFTVSTERYLLSRRFYFYTAAQPKPLVHDLLEYIASDAAGQTLRAAGFTDLGVSLKNAEPCAGCSPRYAALTKRARRLSLDFRFRPGSNALDARATRDIDRVVAFVREHPTGKVLLLGFCDSSNDAKADRKRSRELAQIVDAELAARGLRAGVIEGFGTDMPVATNATDFGRTKNRRVEIWLEDR